MLLEIDNVSKLFGGLTALGNISFGVEEGEILGIMGANGAGKTTLFALIAGHSKPSQGSIRLDGRDITGKRPDRINALGVARTYQIVRPFRGLSVEENVMAGVLYGAGRTRGVEDARQAARRVLDDVGLGDRAGDPASTLTLAGFKRLELAKALATKPKILLLDEVMAGLTPAEVSQALSIIETCKAKYGLTVVVIEHVMKALMRMCGRIVVLHHGQMIAVGRPEEVARDEKVIEAYLGSTP